MPITINVPELELEDLPDWVLEWPNPQAILEKCRDSLNYRADIFSAQTEQGRDLAVHQEIR